MNFPTCITALLANCFKPMAIWTAFILGLTGSLHCLGMCGPLVLAVSSVTAGGNRRVLGKLIYHSGRLAAYMLIGIVFGIIGKAVSFAGLQQWLSLLLGAGILIGLMAGINTGSAKFISRGIGLLKHRLSALLQRKSLSSQVSLGFLNGFLPCGLVYIAAAGSITTGSVGNAMLYMLAFGLGTLPLMLATSLTANFLQPFRLKFQKAIPVVLFVMAVLLIFRGMSLGIPYLSPDLATMEHHHSMH